MLTTLAAIAIALLFCTACFAFAARAEHHEHGPGITLVLDFDPSSSWLAPGCERTGTERWHTLDNEPPREQVSVQPKPPNPGADPVTN